MLTTVVAFFQQGGPFMYPIAFVLALGVGIALERWLFLAWQAGRNRRDFARLLPLLKQKDLKALKQHVQGSDSAVAHILRDGLARLPTTRRRQDIEYAMEEGLLEFLPRLEKRTQYVATFANVATLLGLLGTIIGLIAAFTAVADANPSEKAELLSRSISVAMNTTAFGLMAAIPLLVVHAVLQSKTTELVEQIEAATVKFLNLLSDRREADAA